MTETGVGRRTSGARPLGEDKTSNQMNTQGFDDIRRVKQQPNGSGGSGRRTGVLHERTQLGNLHGLYGLYRIF
jgi:hypothetical protein